MNSITSTSDRQIIETLDFLDEYHLDSLEDYNYVDDRPLGDLQVEYELDCRDRSRDMMR